jgi:hypothetical protein
MVTNAKDFFPRNSQTYEDAERVRKALSNYMVKTNPAYQTPGYTAVPTPLPPDDAEEGSNGDGANGNEGGQGQEPDVPANGQPDANGDDDDDDAGSGGEVDPEDEEGDQEDDDGDEDTSQASNFPTRRGPGRPPKNPVLHAKKMAAKAARQEKADSKYENVPYSGLTFQQAQEKIAEELIRKREDE